MLLVVFGAIAALLIGSIAAATDGSSTATPHFDHMSNAGQAVNLPGRALDMLTHAGGTEAVRKLGTSDNLSFYVAPSAKGGVCFAVGVPELGVSGVGCPVTGTTFAFPSDSQPIFDMSITAFDPVTDANTVGALEGFAADGVAKIGVIDAQGTLTTATDVHGNVYGRRYLPAVDAKAIVALNASGHEIYRQVLLSPQ